MTKSNMQTVRRRTNQRIARQYDRVEQERVRAYEQRNIEKRATATEKRMQSFLRKAINYFKSAFDRFFSALRPSYRGLRSLDLRHSDAARFGPFYPGARRNAGAAWLRDVFSQNLKMISTRDGRWV